MCEWWLNRILTNRFTACRWAVQWTVFRCCFNLSVLQFGCNGKTASFAGSRQQAAPAWLLIRQRLSVWRRGDPDQRCRAESAKPNARRWVETPCTRRSRTFAHQRPNLRINNISLPLSIFVTFLETRRNSSRPGSKAGSRGSSRRGSDASDFDISDIQSVCSDASETVGDTTRGTPRSASRQQGGRPSKIPTPQKRTTPTSKLAKGSKR